VINDSLSDTVRSDETRILWGTDHYYETLLGLSFRISSFSFFQPNSYAAEVLYSKVREYVGDTKDMNVFDLYSGTGTIAQLAAAVAKEVTGVEIVEEAVQAAQANAARNGLTNCRFIAADVLRFLEETDQKPDLIILDPPRDGIHPKALPKIIDFGVERIVYISCKATSLARDLPEFLKAGYRVEKACCVDQFCQTVHVECVVLMSRAGR
jgi:23S rRNA (uracil-5-)-methyltransferase RumA